MSEKTYTHKDLATFLGVSETTVKSYRRKFPGCIPVANQGKPIRFTGDAVKVAVRIRDLFETGMCVEEVRNRLSAEFAWIAPEPGNGQAGQASLRRVSRVSAPGQEIGPEISIGVSNMAKSMVAMTQHQKSMLARLDAIEAILRQLGMGPEDFAELRAKNAEAARAEREAAEARLAAIDAAVDRLAGAVAEMSGSLARLLPGRERKEGSSPLPDTERDASHDEHGEETSMQPPAWEDEETEHDKISKNDAVHTRVRPPVPEPSKPSTDSVDVSAAEAGPSRDFFGLPMVVRTQAGRYVSAGGKGRGRFSLTDLKALLGYAAAGAMQTSMRWERHGQGWWLFLEGEENGETVKLLLMEMPTQKSGHVAEILKLRTGDTDMHPAEFAVLLDRFSSPEA